jgi:hypothetical protein
MTIWTQEGMALEGAIQIKQYDDLTLCFCQDRLILVDQQGWIVKSLDIADFVLSIPNHPMDGYEKVLDTID